MENLLLWIDKKISDKNETKPQSADDKWRSAGMALCAWQRKKRGDNKNTISLTVNISADNAQKFENYLDRTAPAQTFQSGLARAITGFVMLVVLRTRSRLRPGSSLMRRRMLTVEDMSEYPFSYGWDGT